MDKATQDNETFYDQAAWIYEEADGMRGEKSLLWKYADEMIFSLANSVKKCYSPRPTMFLDIGAGTGFISKIAVKYFDIVVATDVSQMMLNRISDRRIIRVKSDLHKLPEIFSPNTFQCAVCFATLHHLEKPESIAQAVAPILAKGGIFYSDHDLESSFYSRFGPLVDLYRMIKAPEKRFGIGSYYSRAEVHSKGIESDLVVQSLRQSGFGSVESQCHWGGFLPLAAQLAPGFAPYVAIKGVKS